VSCQLCGGSKQEHENRKHKFVAEGDPETLQLSRLTAPAKTTPMRLALESPYDVNGTIASVKRLLVMMRDKGLITDAEVVGVLTGEMPRDPHASTDR
jgi:hypothetical protein